jgi:hypothetical protein
MARRVKLVLGPLPCSSCGRLVTWRKVGRRYVLFDDHGRHEHGS